MTWDFLDAFTFRRYGVQIVFKGPVRFPWFHGPVLYALLCRTLCRHPLGAEIALIPVESGILDFQDGERYAFGVTVFGKSPGFPERLAEGLRREGATPRNDDAFPAFDLLSVDELPAAPAGLETAAGYDLRFVTPLRMERREPLPGKRFFDPAFFDGKRFLRLLFDRVYDLSKLSVDKPPPYGAPVVPDVAVSDMTLLWVDAPYHGGAKTCGGVIGTLRIAAEFDEPWKRLLHLGRFSHAGRNAALGFGNYRCGPADDAPPVAPARSLIDRIVDRHNLTLAFEHVQSKCDGPLDGFAGALDDNLAAIAGTVVRGAYVPEPLSGFVAPKRSGAGVRALAMPSVKDRILQRAACQVLGPLVDGLLEESSFAYRKGLSRKSAAHAIQRARQDGFGFVLLSDINAFFDTVSWEKLERKINALFPDPAIVTLLKQWLRQDVVFRGQRIRRSRGLVQGDAVSPLLANLYLDDFDEALQENFRLIRYADDFVILCKSEEEAKKALVRAREALKPLALDLKVEKTDFVDFDRGFQYLGYLFCRSLVLETDKDKPADIKPGEISEAMVPPESWLTHVDFRKVRALAPAIKTGIQKIGAAKREAGERGITVYLSDPKIFVRLSGETLSLSKLDEPDAAATTIPIREIDALVDYGKPSVSMFVLTELGKRGIPIYFCHPNGAVYLTISGLLPQFDLWSRQERFRSDGDRTLAFAKAVVGAKIHNYLTICRRQEWDGAGVKRMKALEEKSGRCLDVGALRGCEGKAAAEWFSLLREHLDPVWGFTGRMKHPPADPVNAMLSFGYSCLYHHVSTALLLRGLNPGIGWFHENRPNYHALACDIQEEFRPMVDSLVLTLVHRAMVSPEEFIMDDAGPFPCVMTKEFRKKYLKLLEEKLIAESAPGDDGSRTTYRDFFVRQAKRIEDMCHSPEVRYEPLRTR